MKRTLFLVFCLFVSVGWMQAQMRLADVQVQTEWDAALQQGVLKLQTCLRHWEGKRMGGELQYQLINQQGAKVLAGTVRIKKQQTLVDIPEQRVAHPCLWNAEHPCLYTLVVRLQQPKGKIMDEYRQKVAFRQIKMDDKQLIVNGVPVRIKGVHFHWNKNGLTTNQLRQYIEQWKKCHVNAVRVSALPQHVPFAELCNEYGLYLLDESAGLDPTHPALREGCLWDWPNRDLPVKLVEMQKLYQDIRFMDFNREAGTVKVQNDFSFTSLDDFDFYYLIRDHGKEVYRDRLQGIQAEPGQSVVSGKMKGYSLDRNTTGDVRIEFYAVRRGDDPLASQAVVAREQTYIHTFFRPTQLPVVDTPLITEVVDTPETVVLQGDLLKIVFSRRSGQLVSYQYLGEEYIQDKQGPRPFFWRAPTASDRIARLPEVLKAWREASYQELTAALFTCVRGEKEVATLKATYLFPQTDAQWDVTYKVYPNGVVKVDNHFVANGTETPLIPRVGLRVKLNPALHTIQYFGRGPRTNYRDCRTAQFLGTYTSAISDMHEKCSYLQENSHRTDIYWCALTGNMNGGLLLVADRTFEMNVGYESLEALEGIVKPCTVAEKTHENILSVDSLSPVDFFIDYRMMGIGADNRKGTPVQEPYLIRPGKENAIDYGFAIIPFAKDTHYEKWILRYN